MASRNRKSSTSQKRRPKASASERASKIGESATGQESASGEAPEADAFRIVAIGGSSGSLEALERLLPALQPQTRMSFVFIQHLDPMHESMLAEILGRSSKLTITQARDGDEVAPEHLYVIPPSADLSIKGGALRLTPRKDSKGQHLPIDTFFRDLAADVGPRSVGVVLSGSGFDGSLGLLAIKAEGGITFAQEPSSAKFDSMPRSAIATGEVDFVLAPEEIAAELSRLPERALAMRQPSSADSTLGQSALSDILRVLTAVTGHDLSFYKPANLSRRVRRRMLLAHVGTIEAYAKLLHENTTEVQSLYNDILISVTSFFRDGASVTVFSDVVFSEILKNRRENKPIRIWAPGCSTGEEAYSLAIALMEFSESKGLRLSAQIFATDLREAAIERARAGIYPPAIASDVSPARLRRFFHETDNGYQVSAAIREQCIFAQHNLLIDPPFSQLDLVSCRNVLIYFKPEYQTRAMSTFYYALKPTGLLVLGRSESPGASDLFSPVDARHRVYRKNPNAVRGNAGLFGGERLTLQTSHNPRRYHNRQDVTDDLQKEADKLLLQTFAPPGVVVNDQFEVVQFRGRTGPFLEAPSGHATLNLIKLAREEFRLELQALLYDVRKRKTRVRKERLSVRRNGGQLWFAAEAAPLDAFGEGKFFLVLFHEQPAATTPEVGGDSGNGQMEKLRDELNSAKAQLQAIIEELEATNEEIKAANEEVLSSNEELQSMNEELETAKEELQSANEELTTVNEELQNRNTELSHVAADLGNLLASVNIPILMLSRDLRIRRYTPSATKVLNLIQSDIGRPITDINLNVSIPDLENMLFHAMESMSPQERDVSDKSDRRYLLRAQPFKTLENRIDGVVLMLLDRQGTVGSVERLKPASDYAEAVAEMVDRPLAVLDGETKIQNANEAFRKELSLEGNPAGRYLRDAFSGLANAAEFERLIQQTLERKDGARAIAIATTSDRGETRQYRAMVRRLRLKTPDAPALILLELERGDR